MAKENREASEQHGLQCGGHWDSDEQYARLEREVWSMVEMNMMPVGKLELVDTLERLGLRHRFEEEIQQALVHISGDASAALSCRDDDLHATSLSFRLLRAHGIFVSQDAFSKFKGRDGHFEEAWSRDVKGLLSLYEASFLGLEGENVMEEAASFSTWGLKTLLQEHELPPNWEKKVAHALGFPLHWTLSRLEAMWYIDIYRREENMNPTIRKLAILDFNRLQSLHREEFSELERWWMDVGLATLEVGRSSLLESYMFSNAMAFEPPYNRARKVATQVVALITTIDDIYDVYGSINDLKLFTNLADRWDVREIDVLPEKIKICFLAMYNNCNQTGYEILKERGYNVIPHLSKAWSMLLNSFLREAEWYHESSKPTLEEYMRNALVSVGVHIVTLSNYLITAPHLTKQSLDHMNSIPPLIHLTATIFRLINDMDTTQRHMDRGETLKALQCYVHHAGTSEKVAREHMMALIRQSWKKLNGAIILGNTKEFSSAFVNANINLVRAAHFFYEYDEACEAPSVRSKKDHIMSLFLDKVLID